MSSRAKPMRRDYSVEQIDRALSAAVYFDGNTRRAVKALKERGLDVPRSTLNDWVTNTRKNRYMELRKKLEPEIHARAAEEHQDLVRENLEVERAILQRLKREVPNLAARDLSTAGRNAAVAAGVHQDKSATLRGLNPGAPVVNFSMTNLIQSLAAKGTRFSDRDGNPISAEQAIAASKGQAIERTASELQPETRANAKNQDQPSPTSN